MFCNISFLFFIVSTLQKCTKSISTFLSKCQLVHVQACGGGGLVPFPNWLLKPAPSKLCSPQRAPSPRLLCPSWEQRRWCPAPHTASPLPFSHPLKPGPRRRRPGRPPLHPWQKPSVFIWTSKAWQALWLWNYSAGLGAGLIRLWNSVETKGISSAKWKACRSAVRIGVLRTTHEWKKQNGKSFQWACLLCNIKPYNESTFTSL